MKLKSVHYKYLAAKRFTGKDRLHVVSAACIKAIFIRGNGEFENANGERGAGNGESLKRGIFKSGNL